MLVLVLVGPCTLHQIGCRVLPFSDSMPTDAGGGGGGRRRSFSLWVCALCVPFWSRSRVTDEDEDERMTAFASPHGPMHVSHSRTVIAIE